LRREPVRRRREWQLGEISGRDLKALSWVNDWIDGSGEPDVGEGFPDMAGKLRKPGLKMEQISDPAVSVVATLE
jgi:hypothetical protein